MQPDSNVAAHIVGDARDELRMLADLIGLSMKLVSLAIFAASQSDTERSADLFAGAIELHPRIDKLLAQSEHWLDTGAVMEVELLLGPSECLSAPHAVAALLFQLRVMSAAVCDCDYDDTSSRDKLRAAWQTYLSQAEAMTNVGSWPRGTTAELAKLAVADCNTAIRDLYVQTSQGPAAAPTGVREQGAHDLRYAPWFADATKNQLNSERLRGARRDGRLTNCRQDSKNGRWLYSIAEVCSEWNEFAPMLKKKLSDQTGIDRK